MLPSFIVATYRVHSAVVKRGKLSHYTQILERPITENVEAKKNINYVTELKSAAVPNYIIDIP